MVATLRPWCTVAMVVQTLGGDEGRLHQHQQRQTLQGRHDHQIPATVIYGAVTKRATLNPNVNLRIMTRYKAVVTTRGNYRVDNRLGQDPVLSGNQPKQR